MTLKLNTRRKSSWTTAGPIPAEVQIYEPQGLGTINTPTDGSPIYLEPGATLTFAWRIRLHGEMIRTCAQQGGWRQNEEGVYTSDHQWYATVVDPWRTVWDELRLRQTLEGPKMDGTRVVVGYFPFTGNERVATVGRSYHALMERGTRPS